jgi:hypothetical protein
MPPLRPDASVRVPVGQRDEGARVTGDCEEVRAASWWVGCCSIVDPTRRRGKRRRVLVRFQFVPDDPQLEGALNVADLLTSIREELAARLDASRQAVEESDRLQAALRVLDASAGDGRPPRSPGGAGKRGRRGRAATKSRTRSTTPSAVAAAPTLDADGAGSPKGGAQRRRVRRS